MRTIFSFSYARLGLGTPILFFFFLNCADIRSSAFFRAKTCAFSQTLLKLNGTLTGDSITSFKISPNSSHVVYGEGVGLGFSSRPNRLHSAPLSGGSSVELASVGTDRRVSSYEISPNNSRVVYRADPDILNTIELYSAPRDGSSAPIQLNNDLMTGDVESFEISPDSKPRSLSR